MTSPPQSGPPGYPGHPEYQGYPGPPSRRTGARTAVGLAVAAVVVLGLVGTGVYLTTRGDGDRRGAFPGGAAPGGNATDGAVTGNPAPGDATSDPPPSQPPESTPGPDQSRPADTGGEAAVRAATQKYVDAINRQDRAAATRLTCTQKDPGAAYDTLAGELKLAVGKITMFSAESALVTLAEAGSPTNTMPLPVEYHSRWCIPA